MTNKELMNLMEKVKWAKRTIMTHTCSESYKICDACLEVSSHKAQARQMIKDGWRPPQEPPSVEWLASTISSARVEWLECKPSGDRDGYIAAKLHEALKAYYEEQVG